MNMQLSKTPIGLDGVPAAETVLSHVDGERGELIVPHACVQGESVDQDDRGRSLVSRFWKALKKWIVRSR